jgi:ankyrin repeat protein
MVKLLSLASLVLIFANGLALAAMSNDDFTNLSAIGTPEEIAAALKDGADANAKDADGRPALLCAARFNNDPEAAIVLIKSGADVNGADAQGETALMYAVARFSDLELVSLLLDRGAGVEVYDSDGWTPLMYAAEFGSSPKDISALLERGADVNARVTGGSRKGSTPLMNAVRNTRNLKPEMMVSVLLAGGADANAQDGEGKTALIWAAANPQAQSFESVTLLLNAGADAGTRDNGGKTALDYAEETSPKIVDLLRSNGAKNNVPDWRIAYRDRLNEMIDNYGLIAAQHDAIDEASSDELVIFKSNGVTYAELFDFDSDGSLELLVAYSDKQQWKYRIYSYDAAGGSAVQVTDQTAHRPMASDVSYAIEVTSGSGRHYIFSGNNEGPWDPREYYAVENGKWSLAASVLYNDTEDPPRFTINGTVASEEECQAEISRYATDIRTIEPKDSGLDIVNAVLAELEDSGA